MQHDATARPIGFRAGLRFGLGVALALAISMTVSMAVLALGAWLAWAHVKASAVAMATDVVEQVDARRLVVGTARNAAVAARDGVVSATGSVVNGARQAADTGVAAVGNGSARLRDAITGRFTTRTENLVPAPARRTAPADPGRDPATPDP